MEAVLLCKSTGQFGIVHKAFYTEKGSKKTAETVAVKTLKGYSNVYTRNNTVRNDNSLIYSAGHSTTMLEELHTIVSHSHTCYIHVYNI